ncbi:MAG TPA: cupin domain-containing protein [Bacteroidales bacterium]|nr:cupin domain-containing protein [Bacteroidales bacterium]
METNLFSKGKTVNPSEQVEYQTGSIVSKTIVKKEKGNITLFAFDKGQALSEHTAPFDALISVVDGKAEVIIGGNPNIVEAGQMILMPANIPHAVNAVERFKMMLVMVKE